MRRPLLTSPFFHLTQRSLLRANLLVVGSFLWSVRLSGFPQRRATALLGIPALFAFLGLFETVRCMRRRWNFYHGGVLLCIYMDLMAISLILFFWFAPFVM